MRGTAPSRLLCFVTLRYSEGLQWRSGGCKSPDSQIHTQTLLVHVQGLLGIVKRFTSVLDNLHYPTNVTCHNPHPNSSLTRSLGCFGSFDPKGNFTTQFSLFSEFSETGTWLILHISSTPYIPQPHHSGHCMVAFTILRSLETCNRISLLSIENLLGLTNSTRGSIIT